MTTKITLPNSDSIHSVAYDQTTRVLTVWYRSSPREGYNYIGVPRATFSDLLTSSNRGRSIMALKRYVCVPVNTQRMAKPMHKAITVSGGKLLIPDAPLDPIDKRLNTVARKATTKPTATKAVTVTK